MSYSATGSSRHSTSVSLLARMQQSDQQAWSRFVKIYGPLIYRWCRKVPLQPQDAADVSQIVLETVSRKIASFDANRPGATFRGWLWTVTRNKIRDHFRSLSRQSPVAGGQTPDHLAQAEQLPENDPEGESSDADVIRRAIDLLKTEFQPRTWDAFWRATVQEEPVSQIAQETGMTTWAVYQAKSRVLRRARRELAELVNLGESESSGR